MKGEKNEDKLTITLYEEQKTIEIKEKETIYT